MRISDWSSDVCSFDLVAGILLPEIQAAGVAALGDLQDAGEQPALAATRAAAGEAGKDRIGRLRRQDGGGGRRHRGTPKVERSKRAVWRAPAISCLPTNRCR